MTLNDYLSAPDAPSASAFARRCRCSRTHIMRLRRRERTPSLALALRIERASDEEVPVEVWTEEQQDAA